LEFLNFDIRHSFRPSACVIEAWLRASIGFKKRRQVVDRALLMDSIEVNNYKGVEN